MPVGAVSVAQTRVGTDDVSGSPQARSSQANAAEFTAQLQAAQSAQVRPQRTPLSGSQAASAIESAYRELTGENPSKATLAILTSQWSLETAQGERMYNYNFAGLKGKSPEGYTAVLKTREGWGAGERQIRDGFRAYGSAEAGAKDYVSLLLRRYDSAVDAAKAEDPVAFAAELKAKGYYTGNEREYAAAVTRLANQAMGLGFDALGTSGEALPESAPLTPYFDLTKEAPALDAATWVRGLASAVDGTRTVAPQELSSRAAAAFTDEISRAALRIAARYGA